MENNLSQAKLGIIMTWLLGVVFTLLQAIEYLETTFTMADRVYGSVFFIATGFHGLHVIIGTLFLMVTHYRIYKGHFRSKHHFGFEARAWYWHFVDVVWLFLFCCIYVWASVGATIAAH